MIQINGFRQIGGIGAEATKPVTGSPKEEVPVSIYTQAGEVINTGNVEVKLETGVIKQSGVNVEQQKNKKSPDNLVEYLKNDSNYQTHKEEYQAVKSDLMDLCRKYNVAAGDIDDAKKKITDPKELQIYISSMEKLYTERNSLAAYEKEMQNWQDGPLNRFALVRRNGEDTGTGGNYTEFKRGNEIYVQHNGQTYTNVERITLKNGQHVWKSDQGTFYPWSNGKIGIDQVPPELL